MQNAAGSFWLCFAQEFWHCCLRANNAQNRKGLKTAHANNTTLRMAFDATSQQQQQQQQQQQRWNRVGSVVLQTSKHRYLIIQFTAVDAEQMLIAPEQKWQIEAMSLHCNDKRQKRRTPPSLHLFRFGDVCVGTWVRVCGRRIGHT